MAESIHAWYGWKKDQPDFRDLKMKVSRLVKVPAKVDLSKPTFPIFNQGALGSCTANAAGMAYLFGCIKQGTLKLSKLKWLPSRLFVYYNTRVMEGTVAIDNGATIRNTIKCISKQGVCEEALCAYNVSRFKVKPSKTAYADGLTHQSVIYQSVAQTLNQLKACLASGYPIVFGFMVYDSFESPEVALTGLVPMPTATNVPMGGHAVMAVGYDDATRQFKVQNSWGKDWGAKGYFYLPYEYMTNPRLAADFWTIQKVEG